MEFWRGTAPARAWVASFFPSLQHICYAFMEILEQNTPLFIRFYMGIVGFQDRLFTQPALVRPRKNSVAEGCCDCLRAIGHLQLLHDVVYVVADRVIADIKGPGDLLVCRALSEQFQRLQFASSEIGAHQA